MDTIQFLLILLIVYVIYKILEIHSKMVKFNSKLKMIMEMEIGNEPLEIKQQIEELELINDSETEIESDNDLLQGLKQMENVHIENYEMLVRLLRYAIKNGNTKIVQNITGPSNNNNTNVDVQVNLLPMFPLLNTSSICFP